MSYIPDTLTASQTKHYNLHGKYFVLLEASNPLAKIRFFKNHAIIDEVENLGAGLRFEGEFHGVEVVAQAGGSTIAFHVSDDKVEYQRGAASVDILSIKNNTAPTQTANTVTNTSGLLAAANANRRSLIIQNKDAAGIIYVNFTGVAATVANGYQIGPKETLILDIWNSSAALYAIGDIASNANILVIEG